MLHIIGVQYIERKIKNLKPDHQLHIAIHRNNEMRVTGHYETSSKDEFSYGEENCAYSVHFPTSTAADKKLT